MAIPLVGRFLLEIRKKKFPEAYGRPRAKRGRSKLNAARFICKKHEKTGYGKSTWVIRGMRSGDGKP